MREKRLSREYLELSEQYRKAGDSNLAWIAFQTHKYYQRIYLRKMDLINKKSA